MSMQYPFYLRTRGVFIENFFSLPFKQYINTGQMSNKANIALIYKRISSRHTVKSSENDCRSVAMTHSNIF